MGAGYACTGREGLHRGKEILLVLGTQNSPGCCCHTLVCPGGELSPPLPYLQHFSHLLFECLDPPMNVKIVLLKIQS